MIDGKSVLHRCLDALADAGAAEVALLVDVNAERVEAHAREWPGANPVEVHRRASTLPPAPGELVHLRAAVQDLNLRGYVYVVNCNAVTAYSLRALETRLSSWPNAEAVLGISPMVRVNRRQVDPDIAIAELRPSNRPALLGLLAHLVAHVGGVGRGLVLVDCVHDGLDHVGLGAPHRDQARSRQPGSRPCARSRRNGRHASA